MDDMKQGGYCIEIRVDADNKVSVGVESTSDKPEYEEGEYQQVGSIQEAMAIVKDIFANSGNVQEGMKQSMSDMSEGYSE